MTPSAPQAPGRRLPGWIAVLLSLVLALAAAEIALRVARFRYELKVQVVEAQAPNREKVFEGYTVDRDLLWVRRAYPEILDRALSLHPRLVFLGDSCTEFGDYDRRLDRRLRAAGTPMTWANFGCAGWSTWQGRIQMQRDVRRAAPAVVTIFYGWNDHWRSVGLDDRDVSRFNGTFLYRVRGLRLAQLATKALVAFRAHRPGGPPPRVSEADFAANLESMIATARSFGAVPVLITAPTPAREGEGRWTGALARFPEIHRRYEEIVRTIAARDHAVLCDLAAIFDAIPPAELRADGFYRDEVHLTDAGNERIADALYDCLRTNGLTGR